MKLIIEQLTISNYLVIGGPSSAILAKKIAKRLGSKYLKTTLRVFPDGEQKITLEGKIKAKKIIVVQSTEPPVDSNILQVLSLISKASEMGSEVIAVIPYFGYAKQDKEFLKGEIVSLSVMAKLFKSVGLKKLIVVDFHSQEGLSFFRIPVKNLTATTLLASYSKKLKLKDPLVVAPDLFWKEKAKEFATLIGASSIALNKKRNRKTGSLEILSKKFVIKKGRDLIIFDDMVSTGGSAVKAIKFLERKNFRKIYVICTHPVMAKDSEKNLKPLGVKVIGTNSIVGKYSQVDVSRVISQGIINWN